jgi:hypothetical protein
VSTWTQHVRHALGETGQLRCGAIDDGRILRVVMATIYPEPRDALIASAIDPTAVAEVACALAEPVALVERVLAVHTQPTSRRRWLLDNSSVAATAYIRARRTGRASLSGLPASWRAGTTLGSGPFGAEWSIAGSVATLQPCSACQGTSRIPLRLREADGSVCRTCRTDRSGVRWPASYDRYRHVR